MRALLIVLSLCLLLPAWCAEEASPPQTGASLAGLALYDLQGRRQSLDDIRTKQVVIIWWAFWCDTWEKALPHVNELAARAEELDCTVWTISVDGTYTAEARERVERGDIHFPMLLDDRTWADRLHLRRVPTVMLLDAERKVVWLREAYPGNAVIERAIWTGK